MKKIILPLLLTCTINYTFSQETNVSDIIPSSAPAFTVLGVSPIEISKPNSWNALQTSLYQNLLSNGQFGVPKNLALEFSPFWLKSHPTFTYKDYLNQDGFSLRNLSLSIASAKIPYGPDSVQAMGLGFRLPIIGKGLALKKKDELTQFIDSKKAQTTDWQVNLTAYVVNYATNNPNKKIGDLLEALLEELNKPSASGFGPTFKKNKDKILKIYAEVLYPSLQEKINNEVDVAEITELLSAEYSKQNYSTAASITQEISKALKEVSKLEFCGALSWAYPTNDFYFSRAAKLAFWGDYSFNLSSSFRFNGTMALRYVKDFEFDKIKGANNLDGIVRFNYSFDKTQKFTISGWALLRLKWTKIESVVINNEKYYKVESDHDNKYGVDISYKLSDNIAVSYSFGKNYSKETTLNNTKNALINYLNLFYAINTKIEKKGNDYVFKSF